MRKNLNITSAQMCNITASMTLKLVTIDGKTMSVPLASDNKELRRNHEWVAAGTLTIQDAD